jgi:hypothetical protein
MPPLYTCIHILVHGYARIHTYPYTRTHTHTQTHTGTARQPTFPPTSSPRSAAAETPTPILNHLHTRTHLAQRGCQLFCPPAAPALLQLGHDGAQLLAFCAAAPDGGPSRGGSRQWRRCTQTKQRCDQPCVVFLQFSHSIYNY